MVPQPTLTFCAFVNSVKQRVHPLLLNVCRMVEQGWGEEFGQWVGSFELCTCTGSRGVTVGHLPLLLQPKGWLSLMSGWWGGGGV